MSKGDTIYYFENIAKVILDKVFAGTTKDKRTFHYNRSETGNVSKVIIPFCTAVGHEDEDEMGNIISGAGGTGLSSTTVQNMIDATVNPVKTNVTTNASDISGLKTSVSGHSVAISTLQSDMSTAKSNIVSINGDIVTIGGAITNINTSISNLGDAVNGKLSSVAADGTTITGDGTSGDPLVAVGGGGGGLTSVATDDTLTGDGTTGDPLSVVGGSPSTPTDNRLFVTATSDEAITAGSVTNKLVYTYVEDGELRFKSAVAGSTPGAGRRATGYITGSVSVDQEDVKVYLNGVFKQPALIAETGVAFLGKDTFGGAVPDVPQSGSDIAQIVGDVVPGGIIFRAGIPLKTKT